MITFGYLTELVSEGFVTVAPHLRRKGEQLVLSMPRFFGGCHKRRCLKH